MYCKLLKFFLWLGFIFFLEGCGYVPLGKEYHSKNTKEYFQQIYVLPLNTPVEQRMRMRFIEFFGTENTIQAKYSLSLKNKFQELSEIRDSTGLSSRNAIVLETIFVLEKNSLQGKEIVLQDFMKESISLNISLNQFSYLEAMSIAQEQLVDKMVEEIYQKLLIYFMYKNT